MLAAPFTLFAKSNKPDGIVVKDVQLPKVPANIFGPPLVRLANKLEPMEFKLVQP